jgi:hypothetical protein
MFYHAKKHIISNGAYSLKRILETQYAKEFWEIIFFCDTIIYNIIIKGHKFQKNSKRETAHQLVLVTQGDFPKQIDY